MKTKQMMVMGLAAICAMALAGEASARGGKGGGGSNGQGMYNGTAAQTAAVGTVTRPAGSQRRDGTFMTTGTTANGGTTRPGNGNGLQDGSHMTVTPVIAPATVTVAP